MLSYRLLCLFCLFNQSTAFFVDFFETLSQDNTSGLAMVRVVNVIYCCDDKRIGIQPCKQCQISIRNKKSPLII